MSDQLTEQEIVDGTPIPVDLPGSERKLFIRQPRTEEYDDAMAVMGVVETKWRRRPDVEAAADTRCSDAERASIQFTLNRIALRMSELPDDAKDERRALRAREAALLGELDTRTLADEVATDRAALARDRYLARVLLVENDEPVVKTDADWEKLPLVVKNACRPAIWKAINAYENAPFV